MFDTDLHLAPELQFLRDTYDNEGPEAFDRAVADLLAKLAALVVYTGGLAGHNDDGVFRLNKMLSGVRAAHSPPLREVQS